MKKISIIDFGAGNIHSIKNAISQIVGKDNVAIIKEAGDLVSASHIILPGVGAFDKAMHNLSANKNLILRLEEEVINRKTPFLGICIGMQILADKGYENGVVSGLGWVPGEVKHIPKENLIIPHIGWNNITLANNNKKDFSCFDGKDFYFVHSYYFQCKKQEDIVAYVEYGESFPAIVAKDNIIATQFHPEKSGDNGLEFLKFFIE